MGKEGRIVTRLRITEFILDVKLTRGGRNGDDTCRLTECWWRKTKDVWKSTSLKSQARRNADRRGQRRVSGCSRLQKPLDVEANRCAPGGPRIWTRKMSARNRWRSASGRGIRCRRRESRGGKVNAGVGVEVDVEVGVGVGWMSDVEVEADVMSVSGKKRGWYFEPRSAHRSFVSA